MWVVVLHKHSFTQYQFKATSISYTDGVYDIVEGSGSQQQVHSFEEENYIVALMGKE